MCPDCGGCTDDTCGGGCCRRWCGGAYLGTGCDRCPHKVPKQILDSKGRERTIQVRCNAPAEHGGCCHWDPWKARR